MSHITTRDGVHLALATRGPATAPPLLFAHGFGQSRRAWTRAAHTLAGDDNAAFTAAIEPFVVTLNPAAAEPAHACAAGLRGSS